MSDESVHAATAASRTFGRLARDSGFRKLWIAQLVSGIGDWLIIGLLIPLVTALSGGSSFAVAGILIAKIIPSLVLSSFTGALVDAFDRRRVMIVADVVRIALTLALLATNSLSVIYVIVFLMETASLFFWPARNALIPHIVDERDIVSANGAMYTTQQAAMVIGLTASGAIVAGFEAVVRVVIAADLPVVDYFVGLLAPALLGPRAGFFLNAITFAFSAVTIASITVTAREPKAARRLGLRLLGKDALESFRFLGQHRELRGLLGTVFLAILGGGAIIPVGLDYVSSLVTGELFAEQIAWLQKLAGSSQTFILVFMAVGMVAGAVAVQRLEKHVPMTILFVGSVAAFGVAMLGFASVSVYWAAGFFAAVAGACIATLTVAGNSYIIRTTDDSVRGRVFTAMESVVRVALLISMVVTAPLNDLISKLVIDAVNEYGLAPESVVLTAPRVTLMLSAGIVIAAAVYGFIALRWREYDDGSDTQVVVAVDGSGEDGAT